MMYIVSGLIVVFLAGCAYSFNFDTNFPIVYTDPYNFTRGTGLERSSYFGYSVLLYNGGLNNKPWIQIGAPRGSNPNYENKATGVVFRCDIKSPCRHLELVPQADQGYPDEAFFGFNMDITSDSTSYTTCGPRWIFKHATSGYYMQGACFAGDTEGERPKFVTPFNGDTDQTINIAAPGAKEQFAYNKAQGQLGFAAQFRQESAELIVGIPGMLNWKGVAGLLGETHDVPMNRRRSKREADNLLTEKLIPNAKAIKESSFFDLMGYSVTSGKFYDDSVYIVAGAPRARQKGTVLVFKFKSSSENLDVKEKKEGLQFGEYFGSSLTASDINNDGLDDLIVGAPFHKGSDSKYDEGKIYIYLGSPIALQAASTNVISGKSSGSRFGETVMSIGDIDKDGYADIAVAAPYENENTGVVYIFRGDKQAGLIKEPAQRIVGRDIIPSVRGFGISLSKSTDIDNNHYNDFAIGAYNSGHAILLRAKPVVHLRHKLTSSTSQVNAAMKQNFNFTITSCVAFTGQELNSSIRVVRTISVDKDVPGRAYLVNQQDVNKVAVLEKPDQDYCQTYDVRSSKTDNVDIPIAIKASVDLEKKTESSDVIQVTDTVTGNDQFCSTCAILSPYTSSDRDKQINVDFNKDCGSDNICTSDLSLSASFVDLDKGTYIIGSKSYVDMEIIVENQEENAYQTEVHITLPDLVGLRRMPTSCKKNNMQISCNVDNPLGRLSKKMVALELDFNEVNSGKSEDKLSFILSVTTSSINNGISEKNLSLALVKYADVEIMGKSGEETYSYSNRTYGKATFQQIFKVLKHEISPIQKVELTVEVPTTINANNKQVTFISLSSADGTLAGQPITCQVLKIPIEVYSNADIAADLENVEKKKRRRRDVEVTDVDPVELSEYPANRTIYMNCSNTAITCGMVKCSLGPFTNVKNSAEIKLKMKLDISGLADYDVNKDVVILSTSASVKIIDHVSNNDTHRHSISVATVFIGPSEKSIATWIIIVAVICGILLLLIVAGVLYKLGFFKRTKKEQLIKEKAEKSAVRT